ncbi:MAG: septal ring factor EnvC (AmiA/AmiB activator) [Candidatus Azotimanducaceae bacterium]|jgi:septal ring factor EnvC (AmiA/AmiB activator)
MNLVIFIGIFILTIPTLTLAEDAHDPAKIQQELQALEDEINKFRSLLNDTQTQRSKVEGTLEKNETDINEILNKINEIQKDLKKGKKEISYLQSQQNKLLDQRLDQQKSIAAQINASYKLGSQQYLKVVLNQEDPNELSRMLSYYDYFNKARTSQIKTYEATLTDLTKVEAQISQQNQKLMSATAQLDTQQTGLLVIQNSNKRVLASLNKEITKTGNAIEKRIEDREHLETLLERITVGIAKLSIPISADPFKNMRGNLLLPVSGNISHQFGSVRSAGKLKWDGIFIEAPEGESVHSIHYGQVVFSDWLRGFGLLLIINHGEGYMSLYGHNQVLYREAGDWIAEGELIAKVGNSGGQAKSGLYFEIRNGGKPTNPQLWCQTRAVSKAA